MFSISPSPKTIRRDDAPPNGIAQFQTYAYFTSIDPAKNRHRFYMISWRKAFWDGGAVVRSWGRVAGKGRELVTFYPDRASAQNTIERMVKRRIRRGYQVMEVL
jgi:predicted DNA-binding WGR domain protein